MEHHRLAQKVYNEVLEFPPGLEFLAAPEKARLLKARELPRPADPILWLELDELRDGTTPVRGRPGFRAVLQGGCELADGRFGRAVRLDGKTGRIVVEGEAASLLDLKSFTISLWANADSTDERRGLVSRQRHPAGYALFLWNGSLAAEVGPASVRTADGLYKSGEWYHIALVFEPWKNLSLYTNGRLVESGPAGQATRCPDTQFFLGWNGWGAVRMTPPLDGSPGV